MINDNSFKVTDDITAVESTQTGVHVQNQGNAKLWLEADTERNFTGDPTISMSGYGNELLYQIDTVFGPLGCARYTVAQAGGDLADHEFYTGVCTNSAKNTLNNFSCRTKRFDIGPSQVNSYVDVDLNNNDLLQVATISGPNGGTGNVTFNSNINMPARDITCNDISITGFIANQGNLYLTSTGASGIYIDANNDSTAGANGSGAQNFLNILFRNHGTIFIYEWF